MTDIKKQITWALASIASVAALLGILGGYHLYLDSIHEPKGSTQAGLGAVFLFLKSQNQVIQKHYESIPEAERTARDKDRLQGLQYEENFIDMTQQALGVAPESAND